MIKLQIVGTDVIIKLLGRADTDFKTMSFDGGTKRLQSTIRETIERSYNKYGHIMGEGPWLAEDVLFALTDAGFLYQLDEKSETVERYNVPRGAIS